MRQILFTLYVYSNECRILERPPESEDTVPLLN